MAVGYLLCYREAESASVFVTRPRLVASVESFEYLIALVRRDTLTVVFNRYFGVSVFAVSDGKHYFSRSVLRAVFAAVVDKIVEHAPELGGIDIYLPVLVALEVIYKLYVSLAEGVGGIGCILLEEVLRLYLFKIERYFIKAELREHRKLGNEGVHTLRGVINDSDIAHLFLVRVGYTVEYAGSVAFYSGQRSAEIVRDAGDELHPVLFVFLLLFDRLLEPLAHLFKVRADLTYLIFGAVWHFIVEVAVAQLMGSRLEYGHRLHNALEHENDEQAVCYDYRDDRNDRCDGDDVIALYRYAGAAAVDAGADDCV